MMILGIDTSCDDTSAGVVADGRRVLSSVVHSQVRLHHPHGGVVPELASREHLKNILPVVREALDRARVRAKELDGIAVTVGPGLVGSLLVGLYYAKCLAYAHKIPLVGVNHLEGHILSIFLEEDAPPFPFVALTVSGGHTSLYDVRGYGRYTLLGRTLDDAAGEAFDKVAKILDLGYPGGPVIEQTARDGRPGRIPFPRAYMGRDSFDFSFSGVKTAVALYVRKWRENPAENEDVRTADIAAAFQESVVDVLVHKVMAAREKTGARTVVAAGGVACNGRLRARLTQAAADAGVRVFYPSPAYCTDNGAMIAAAGYHRLLNGERCGLSTDVRSRYPISDLSPMAPCAAAAEIE
ncbi:MAG: tRNA (adenosine(37)-N6)-threonylcarbamoyltransferase complex transferase subunit TsaD [Deltaproteobacteria bacterium]|nr:MAG: tRNA (adenosine(37)-N6)-threonylcarbamoyltransferase complex transferase subunit TsaD [Deltaproteobacteria bacterium]